VIMMVRMKSREDDTTEDTGQPQQEQTGEPGKYYYDDATGYEVYEPTPTLEGDEPDD